MLEVYSDHRTKLASSRCVNHDEKIAILPSKSSRLPLSSQLSQTFHPMLYLCICGIGQVMSIFAHGGDWNPGQLLEGSEFNHCAMLDWSALY